MPAGSTRNSTVMPQNLKNTKLGAAALSCNQSELTDASLISTRHEAGPSVVE